MITNKQTADALRSLSAVSKLYVQLSEEGRARGICVFPGWGGGGVASLTQVLLQEPAGKGEEGPCPNKPGSEAALPKAEA